jgi:hypothetical protein
MYNNKVVKVVINTTFVIHGFKRVPNTIKNNTHNFETLRDAFEFSIEVLKINYKLAENSPNNLFASTSVISYGKNNHIVNKLCFKTYEEICDVNNWHKL